MASWTKYFKAIPTQARLQNQLRIQNSDGGASGSGSVSSHKSFLPEVYSGTPNRIERYTSYWQMDLDSEISRALDTISDFSTQTFDTSQEPFTFNFKDSLTETETKLLTESLKQWCSLNNWQQRLWRMFRNTIMMGDQFFIRDPETFKLIWIDPAKVEKIIVNESSGKEIEQYVVRELDFNLSSLVGSNMLVHDQYAFPGGYPRSGNPASGSGTINYGQSSSPGSRNSRFDNLPGQVAIDAEHVLHLSISEGLDNQWPFGTSILESIYKVYKQKDLLEDAILIYRIVRAPERRVFYIDVGSLSGPRAMQYVEKVKQEIYQRRLPNRNSNGGNAIDATYSPISINEDYYLGTNSEGKGTRIESLAGGDNLGCLLLDTKVKLLDGRDLSILDIESEMKEGKTLWTYSCHPVTGKIAPGKITWAGKTKSDAKVMRITLDNNESITCTLDHRFPIRGTGLIEAQHLKIGQSLISCDTREQDLKPNYSKKYLQIFDHSKNKWEFVHRFVANYFKNTPEERKKVHKVEGKYSVIHHNDFNKFNNSPDNLYWMDHSDHRQLHADQLAEMKINDPEGYAKRSQAIIDANNRRWANDPDRKMHAEKETLKYTEFMYQKVTDYYTSGYHDMQDIAVQLNNDVDFINHWRSVNNSLHAQSKYCEFDFRHVHTILKSVGLDWDKFRIINEKIDPSKFDDEFKALLSIVKESESQVDFCKNANIKRSIFMEKIKPYNFKDYRMVKAFTEVHNHRIINIEFLEETMDVGCLTIDGDEEYHNYHTFSLAAGVFTSNSIDDLKYFNNKMLRGLGIPSSYLPTGPDDGTATYNDGKVGAAYIQEFRFSQYCKRLQNLLAPVLDKEFKLFVKNRGIEIQSNLFELQFFPPQSFSEYRQIQIDSEQISVFSNLMGTEANKYLSKRFAMKRYLGLNDDEILENERLWKEENATKTRNRTGSSPVQNNLGLNNVGVTSPPEDTFGGEDFTNDQELPNSQPEGTEGPGVPEIPASAGSETGTTVNPPPELAPNQ